MTADHLAAEEAIQRAARDTDWHSGDDYAGAPWDMPAMYRDINAQADEANEAWRQEVWSSRMEYEIDDDRPTRAELDMDEWRAS